jgi:hypothetical protein
MGYLCGRAGIYRRLKPASLALTMLPFVKLGLLAAHVSPHRYLSGPAFSPPTSICRQLRPKDTPTACTTGGATDQVVSPIPVSRFVAHFPDPPLRTGRATFTASGSPEGSIPPRELLPGLSPVRRSPVSPQLHGASWLVALQGVALLVPFAMWPAFPASDYYGTSDANRASTADC